MSLTEALANFQAEFRKHTPDDVKGKMGQATQDLQASGLIDRSRRVIVHV